MTETAAAPAKIKISSGAPCAGCSDPRSYPYYTLQITKRLGPWAIVETAGTVKFCQTCFDARFA